MGYGYMKGGIADNCINVGSYISSTMQTEVDGNFSDIPGHAGRIAGTAAYNIDCYSIDTTLINEEIPMEYLTKEDINGESLREEEILKKINQLFT